MNLLADFISFIHIILILFIVLAPLSNIPAILYIHILAVLSLLIHWYFNDSMCSLTLIESYLRGLNPDQTFFHRLVKPFYDISENKLNKIIWIITIILLFISVYKLTKKIMNVIKEKGSLNISCLFSLSEKC